METLGCPLTDEWIKKPWDICTVKYYSAIDRGECECCSDMDEARACYTSEVSQKRETNTEY